MVIHIKTYRWYYDKIACHFYDLLMKWCFLPLGGENRCRDNLISHVEFSPNEKILDMCCGTGGATSAIASRASKDCQIVGMDISWGQIQLAREKKQFPNIELVLGDVNHTGFGDDCFDKVFITHALHEMRRDVRLAVLAEAKRILKEEGEVIVLELDNPDRMLLRLFAGFWLFYWLPFNFETPTRRDMLKQGVEDEVRKVGFRNVRKLSKCGGILQVVHGQK